MAVQEMLLQTEPTFVKKSQQNTAGNSFPAMPVRRVGPCLPDGVPR